MVGHDVVVSWVLYALRMTMGLDNVRRMILRKEIKDNRMVEIGRTFGTEDTEADLIGYLDGIVRTHKKRYLLFTAMNIPDEDMQTHYQAFVVDYRNRSLYMIDPARRVRGQQGIYCAYVSENTIAPFFRTHGFSTTWVKTSHPCQTSIHDVFCQTWTLILQIHLMNHLLASSSDIIIPIPTSQMARYAILADFYKHCVSDIKGVCDEVATEYSDVILHNPDIYGGPKNKKQRATIRSRLLKINPCTTVADLAPKDLLP